MKKYFESKLKYIALAMTLVSISAFNYGCGKSPNARLKNSKLGKDATTAAETDSESTTESEVETELNKLYEAFKDLKASTQKESGNLKKIAKSYVKDVKAKIDAIQNNLLILEGKVNKADSSGLSSNQSLKKEIQELKSNFIQIKERVESTEAINSGASDEDWKSQLADDVLMSLEPMEQKLNNLVLEVQVLKSNEQSNLHETGVVAAASDRRCLFENPLIFGASISAGVEYDPENPQIPNFGMDPVSMLTESGQVDENQRIAEPSPTNGNQANGALQVMSLWNESPDQVDSSSLLAGIDAFYWPTMQMEIGLTQIRTTEDDLHCPTRVSNEVLDLIEKAAENKKPVLLGTVPLEDPDLIDPLVKALGWKQQNQVCVERVNEVIRRECQRENSCFVLDLQEIVAEFHETEEGIEELKKLRPDGVHLSEYGRNFIAKKIVSAIPKGYTCE